MCVFPCVPDDDPSPTTTALPLSHYTECLVTIELTSHTYTPLSETLCFSKLVCTVTVPLSDSDYVNRRASVQQVQLIHRRRAKFFVCKKQCCRQDLFKLIPSKYRAFNQSSTQSCAQLPNKSSLTLTRESVLKRWVSGVWLKVELRQQGCSCTRIH